jgi:tetratricopeptide (TPR) repeat protein
MEQGEGNRNLPKQKPKKNGVSELLELALDFHRKGTLAEARRLYDEILLKDPYHFEALHLSGVVALQVGKLEDAEKLFLSAIKVNSQIASIYLNYGVLLNDLKRLEEALASYDRAIALKPDYAEALNNRGVTLRDLKRFEEALASYDRAIALKPDYAEAYFNRSLLHLLNAKFELAWADYEWRKKKERAIR